MAVSDRFDERDQKLLYQRLSDSFLERENEDEVYLIKRVIGEGGFGKVYEVQHKETGQTGAMKKLPFDPKGKSNSFLMREIKNIIHLRPDVNIVQLRDVFCGQTDHLYIVTELCNMDLAEFFKLKGNRTAGNKFNIAQQSARGVKYLHNHNPPIIHRDIKPQNILIQLSDESGEIVVKIADFGISSTSDACDIIDNATREHLTQTCHTMQTTGWHGTLPYMAPEFFAAMEGVGLKDGKFYFDASVDIFALGVVFAYIFCYNNSDYGEDGGFVALINLLTF